MRKRHLLVFLAGAGLVLGLLLKARPGEVAALVTGARWPGVAVAAAWAVALLVLRGLRLSVVLGGQVVPRRAIGVVALSQLAVALAPLRSGELAMIPLLRVAGVPSTSRAVSSLLAVRVMDAGALLLWAAGAALVEGLDPLRATLLLVVLVTLASLALAGSGLLLRWAAKRWRHRYRKALRIVLRERTALRRLASNPVRAGLVLASSLAVWACVWGMTLALVRSMGLDWGAGPVLLGVVGASLGAAVPVNAAGSFGTLEVGWTAALAATGVAAPAALAAGFATHLWSVAFTAAFALPGALLLLVHPSSLPISRRAVESATDTAAGDP